MVTTAHYASSSLCQQTDHAASDALVETSSLSLKFLENMEDFGILKHQQVHHDLVQSHCPSLTIAAHGAQVVRPRQWFTQGNITPGKASDSLDGRPGSTHGITAVHGRNHVWSGDGSQSI